jgi:hypothetical protein
MVHKASRVTTMLSTSLVTLSAVAASLTRPTVVIKGVLVGAGTLVVDGFRSLKTKCKHQISICFSCRMNYVNYRSAICIAIY